MFADIAEAITYRQKQVRRRQTCSVSHPEFLVLNRLAHDVPEGGRILEVGTFRFSSALAFIEAMEHDPRLTLACIDRRFKNLALLDRLKPGVKDRITILPGLSQNIMPQLTEPFDLIFIDGDHEFDAVSADLAQAKRLGGVVVAHDSDWASVWRAFSLHFPAGYGGCSVDPWTVPFRPGSDPTHEFGRKGLAIHPGPGWLHADFWQEVRERTLVQGGV